MLFLVGLLYLFAQFRAIQSMDEDLITCGSILKLSNNQDKSRLHSHDVKYGSGSQQQSVTGTNNFDDVNSHWQVLGTADKPCQRGEPIKCGNTVRFLHLTTRCHLHSHDFPAPLSRNYQEISCFGKDGDGDSGDYWKVICNDDFWSDADVIQLKHQDTGKFLGTSGNQYGRPIAGQKEVVGLSSGSPYTAYWKSAEGIYIKKKDNESL